MLLNYLPCTQCVPLFMTNLHAKCTLCCQRPLLSMSFGAWRSLIAVHFSCKHFHPAQSETVFAPCRSVVNFAKAFKEKKLPLHTLVNNAGASPDSHYPLMFWDTAPHSNKSPKQAQPVATVSRGFGKYCRVVYAYTEIETFALDSGTQNSNKAPSSGVQVCSWCRTTTPRRALRPQLASTISATSC